MKAQDVVFSRGKYVEQDVSINLNRAVFTVSEKFLSVAIASGIMKNHWRRVNFTSEKFFTLARALSPAFLRIGGAREDFLIYDDSQGLQKFKNFTNFTISHHDLDKIHLLSSKAGWDVMFGLNVLFRGRDGSWNASNAIQIMQYVAKQGYHFGWELGNGKTSKFIYLFVRTIAPAFYIKWTTCSLSQFCILAKKKMLFVKCI